MPNASCFGLRRQAERDAALEPAHHLGCHTKALSPLRSASAVQKWSLGSAISIFHPPPSIRYASVVHFRKITIIGVGLLGGSIGLAVRRRKLAREIAGFVRRRASLKDCEKAGAVDFATTDLLAAVSDADLVILCTPLAQMRSRVREMLPALKRGAIVTDVGSVKAGVVRELESLLQKSGAHFVGSHPMAGAEKTGVGAARADLFVNAVCVVTPTKKIKPGRRPQGGTILEIAGCARAAIDAGTCTICSSAGPAICRTSSRRLWPTWFWIRRIPNLRPRLCANGFRDTTRIASGSPEMWRDIALANRKNLAKSLDAFIAELQKFQPRLKKADAKAIATFFETAKQRRDNWCAGWPHLHRNESTTDEHG